MSFLFNFFLESLVLHLDFVCFLGNFDELQKVVSFQKNVL
jgi:hypothetical protein